MYYRLDNILPVVQDYDLFDSPTGALVLFQGTDFSSIAAYFNATGLCQKCIAGSPAIDAGVIIPGINNQNFLGTGPDLGTLEF